MSFFMIQDHGIEFMRQGEDHVEVVDRQISACVWPASAPGHMLAFGAVAFRQE